MVGFHKSFGFGIVESIRADIVKISFDGISEKSIIRSKINIINDTFAIYIIEGQFENGSYENENLADFSFTNVSYNEEQNKFTLFDNYQNQIDIEFVNGKATTICSCIDTFDCIHGYAALKYLKEMLSSFDSENQNLSFYLDQKLDDDYFDYHHIKQFIKASRQEEMDKVVYLLNEEPDCAYVIEVITAGFMADKNRYASYVSAVNNLRLSRFKMTALDFIKRYEKMIGLYDNEARDSDRQSTVILYYYFNDLFKKIIEYVNNRDLNKNSWMLVGKIIDEVCQNISLDDKKEMINNPNLEDFCYNQLVKSLEPDMQKEILENISNDRYLDKELYDYAPNSYLESQIEKGVRAAISYALENQERKFSDKIIVRALIVLQLNSYLSTRWLDEIRKHPNTRALCYTLDQMESLYKARRLYDNAIILDTSSLDLSKNNYLNIDEVDLFSYMKPFIYVDERTDELFYGLAILGKYICLEVEHNETGEDIEDICYVNYEYPCFIYTFIKQNFNDKFSEARKLCEKHKQEKHRRMILNSFNLLADDFTKNITKYSVSVSAKAHLELSFIFSGDGIYLSFRIGVDKLYIVPDVTEFIRLFRLNERKSYGKFFSFVHSLDNLADPYRAVVKLLMEFPISSMANKKMLKATPDLASHIIDLLKGEHVNFDEKYMFLDLSPKRIKVEVNDKMELQLGLNENQSVLELGDNQYIVDKEALIVYTITPDARYRQFINLACKLNGINLEPVIERFNDEIYPYVNNYLEVSPMVQNNFKISDLEIIAYFDYSNKILSVRESFKHDGADINKSEFKSQDQRKYDEYLAYLESLGFEDGICQAEDHIFDFMAMDFSHLRELASVYLSESIQNHQVVNFQKPTIKIQYHSGIMECFMEDTEYDEEELFKLYQAMKLHKKYALLKNNRIVQMEDDEMAVAMDELHIDKKHPYESVALPIYQALCAYAHKDMIKIDDYLKKMIDELTDFKNASIKLPGLNAKLRPYQIEGYNWLTILAKYHMGGILADDMGLGKTLQIISLITSSDDAKPSLIVCPKSLIFNWKNEFEKFSPNLEIKQIYGNTKLRQDLVSSISGDKKLVYITAYDSLRNDIELYKDIVFKYIILDEAQYIKNVQAEKSLAVKKLKGDSKFALTGTPIENNVIDLWSIFEFVMPGYFEELPVFRVKYNSNDNYPAHIAKKIAPFVLRRTKNNVLKDLPSKFETIIQAPMTVEQRKLYDAHLMMARNALNNGAKAFDILPFILRLRQICVDPRTFKDESFEGGKLQMLKELIVRYIEEGHKILIFSQFVKCLNLIEEILKSLHLKYFMITGETKPEKRIEYTNRFNASDEIKVFLVSLKAGGTGLNLVGADVVIHMDPWWNQAVESQATDRAYRIGQKRNVEVVKLICENTIEERVIELQNMKRDIIDKIISNDDSSITSASLEDIHFVLK